MGVANEFYQDWLAAIGVDDTKAVVGINMSVGYVASQGKKRREETGRAYDILHPLLMADINRAVQTRLEATATRG
jgi:hypothetical protein